MVTVKFLQDYAGYKKGQQHKVSTAKTLEVLTRKGIIEVVKATPETAMAPEGENAMLKPGKVQTRKRKK